MKRVFFCIYFPVLVVSVILYSCAGMFGEEFERIPVQHISTNENLNVESTEIDLQKDEIITLWADFDVEYDGELGLEYQIIVVVNEYDTLEMWTFDPFDSNVNLNTRSVSVNGHHEYRSQAKLMTYEAGETGKHQFNVVVFASQKPDEFTFLKGDLVFRK